MIKNIAFCRRHRQSVEIMLFMEYNKYDSKYQLIMQLILLIYGQGYFLNLFMYERRMTNEDACFTLL